MKVRYDIPGGEATLDFDRVTSMSRRTKTKSGEEEAPPEMVTEVFIEHALRPFKVGGVGGVKLYDAYASGADDQREVV